VTTLLTHPAKAQAPPTQSGSELRPSIPVGLLADQRLTPLCVNVWIVLDQFHVPTMEQVGQMTASTVRGVLNAITRLVRSGWLLRLSRAGGSGCNSYVTLRQTPTAARATEARAERVLATLTRRRTPSPMTETERAVVGAWNHLCAETRKDAETWK